MMDRFYHEWYMILWHKYVLDERWQRVCQLASRGGTALTEDEYRTARKKALRQFGSGQTD